MLHLYYCEMHMDEKEAIKGKLMNQSDNLHYKCL